MYEMSRPMRPRIRISPKMMPARRGGRYVVGGIVMGFWRGFVLVGILGFGVWEGVVDFVDVGGYWGVWLWWIEYGGRSWGRRFVGEGRYVF